MATGTYAPRDVGAPIAKPRRGDARLKANEIKRTRKAREDAAIRAAKRRDGHTCRVPRCRYQHEAFVLDGAHMKDRHRGMGGNPSLDRTTRATVICLCRRHHDDYDKHDALRIEPVTAQDFDGPCEWYERDLETGQFMHIGTETRIGVSTTRGR